MQRKFYVISYENGAVRYMDNATYSEANRYAESNNGGWDYTVEEYDGEDEYFDNI